MDKNRKTRLDILSKMPLLAQLDHRLLQNQDGSHPINQMGTRHERRARKNAVKKISDQYLRHLTFLEKSGVMFPVDQFLRQLAFEYTHRYASSGVGTQPASFNYFEPFLHIRFLPESIAPYAALCTEHNHLFNAVDFFDYLTGVDATAFVVADLMKLPEAEILHFTTNGSILDLTFLGPGEREFVISGFSLVRRGASVHWFMIGGQLFSADEWKETRIDDQEIDLENVPIWKRAIIKESIERHGNKAGLPVALEGTTSAAKTILCGEFDALVAKHISRCIMFETENSFSLFYDDPDAISALGGKVKDDLVRNMMEKIGAAGVMWNLAEGLLQLPHYFEHRVMIADETLRITGKRASGLKGGKGPGANFRIVPALEVQKVGSVVREVRLPHYLTETEGHWRKIAGDAVGQDRTGKPVKGKTWIQISNAWRELNPNVPIVYVKDRVSAAKLKVAEIIDLAMAAKNSVSEAETEQQGAMPELYVLRCAVMDSEVYKVGWTSGKAEVRARQLSSETGIPVAFVVVRAWAHIEAKGLEAEAHAMLAPYRLNDRREFFRAPLKVIEEIIEGVVDRAGRRNQA
jgi:hypothetical protein